MTSTTDKPTLSAQFQPSPSNTGAELLQETSALAKRLYIQLARRPSFFLGGIIQPLMFLVLFGALFAQAPKDTFGVGDAYTEFLAAGVIIFTAFGGALTAGLPLIFDREFGFLNRLLVAPLVSRSSIVLASSLFIVSTALAQTAAISLVSLLLGAHFAGGVTGALVVGLVVSLLVFGFSALSIGLAFALPGHIEMLAAIFVLNLPLVFSSTALAPLRFMPTWLQVVASLNPLTYAIEPIRFLFIHKDWSFASEVLQAPWSSISLLTCLIVLVFFDVVAITLVSAILKKKLA